MRRLQNPSLAVNRLLYVLTNEWEKKNGAPRSTRKGMPVVTTIGRSNRLIYLIQPKFPPSYWGWSTF